MITFKKAVTLALLLAAPFCSPTWAQDTAKKFIIYEYIPYSAHVANGKVATVPALKPYLESIDIHMVDVVYVPRFMTNGRPDKKKIEDIAKSAITTPGIPVSFDTEFGQRFHPETVIPGVSEILRHRIPMHGSRTPPPALTRSIGFIQAWQDRSTSSVPCSTTTTMATLRDGSSPLLTTWKPQRSTTPENPSSPISTLPSSWKRTSGTKRDRYPFAS
jgi:hypothetical protein